MDVLHTAIDVSDIETTSAFYEGLLGLEKAREFEVDGQFNYVVGGEGPAEIQFCEVDSAVDPSGINHIAIGVDDLDAVVAAAVDEWESTIEMEPTLVEDGLRIAFVTDPEGYTLELMEAVEN
ncbi:VOC family protein [Halobellus sp. GM3]|uniref:VOC family protein n=1 Tax=Halobellus sp. GM3 TaxID=3458410 RepID=UPI00403DCDA9